MSGYFVNLLLENFVLYEDQGWWFFWLRALHVDSPAFLPHLPLSPHASFLPSLHAATSISPWVVTMEALEPFRCPAVEQVREGRKGRGGWGWTDW